MRENDGVREVASAIHLTLAALHAIAAVWHVSRKRYLHASLHAAGVVLDGACFVKHLTEKEVRQDEEDIPLFIG